jgi:hypothetical protein
MSSTLVSTGSPVFQNIFTETSLTSSPEGVKALNGVIFSIRVDNSGNSGSSYVYLYFAPTSQITFGTTAPNIVVFVPAGVVINQQFFTGNAAGLAFPVALSIAGTTLSSPPSTLIVSVTFQ